MAEVSQNTVGIKLQVTGAQALGAEFKKATAGLEKFQDGLKSTATSLAGIGAAFISFHALSGFFKAAQESAVATAQLEQALQSTGEGANVAASEFTALADQLQNLTGVSDEAIQDVSRLLLEFTRSAELAKAFTPVVLDLAAAMGTDAVSAAKELGRGLAGETITIRGFKIQAADATELLEKLTAALHGQAEAAMRAKGPIEALRVQWGELEETLGSFLTGVTGDFFKNLAEGLQRLNEELKAFKTEHPALLAFLRDVGGGLGKLVSDNIGKIALGVAGLVGAGGLALLVAAFASLSAPMLIAAAAIAVLTAGLAQFLVSLNSQAIAEWILGIKIMGTTIQDYLVLAIKEAELAWVELKSVVTGGDFSAEIESLTRQIAGLTVKIHEARRARLAKAEGPIGNAFPEAMASRKEMLELEQSQLEIGLRNAETDRERFDILNRQLAVAKELEAIKQKEAGDIATGSVLTEKGLKAAKELTVLAGQRLSIEKQITDLREQQAEKTFAGGAAKRFTEFQEIRATEKEQGLGGVTKGAIAGIQDSMIQLGTTAQQVGSAMSSAIGGAVAGIATGIEGLIKGTLAWHQAIIQVGEAILDSIVKAIAEMIAKMFVSFALQLIFGPIIAAEAATLAKAWAAPAYLASVATEGTAAGVGAAALSSGLATTAALGSFATGGYTGTGPRGQPAGIVHRGEYVVPAETVSRMGLGRLEKTLSSFGNDGGTAVSSGRAINQNLNIFMDRKAWLAANRDDIEAIAINAMARTGWRVNA